MPAILRILPSQNYASLSCLGLCGSYDQGADLWGHDHLEQYEVSHLVGECAHGIVYCQAGHYDHCGYDYHFECCLHLCVFNGRGR